MVKGDINAFRERFSRWKNGEQVYDKGRPINYQGGKDEEEKNTWLDELVVTPNGATRGLKQSYPDMIPVDESQQQEHEFMRRFNKRRSSASNAILQPIKTIAEYAPLSGDVFDMANVVHDTYDKNYASAASYLALAFLPNMIQKPLNTAFKFGLNTIGKKYGRGAANLINDVVTKPRQVVAARLRGQYPLTYTERKKYIERMNNMYSDLMNESDKYELTQGKKRLNIFNGVGYNVLPNRFQRPSIQTTNNVTTDQFNVAEYIPRPGSNGLIRLAHRAKNSNLPSMTDKQRKYVFLHEYTHDLQHDGFFAPLLSASDFDVNQDRYIPDRLKSDMYISTLGYNPFASAIRWNSKANREIKELEKLGEVYDRFDLNKYLTLWESDPDEHVAELRSRILGGDTMDEVYKYMHNRFGTSAQEVDDLIKFGFKNGKDSGIHIKPSHRGRLTALKKRTGKSEAELYRTGGPAVRKMITFARNARKWSRN